MAVPSPQRKASMITDQQIENAEIVGTPSNSGHCLKWWKAHLLGKLSGTQLQALEAMVTLAMCGPKYKTKVCKPVPKPIELAIPRPIHHEANTMSSSAKSLYYSHCIRISFKYRMALGSMNPPLSQIKRKLTSAWGPGAQRKAATKDTKAMIRRMWCTMKSRVALKKRPNNITSTQTERIGCVSKVTCAWSL